MAGSIIEMMQDLVGAGSGAAKRKADEDAAVSVYTPRRVASVADVVPLPSTAIAFRQRLSTVEIVSALMHLQRLTEHRNTRRDLDNRIAELARMDQNIANAQANIANWQRRKAELESLRPYDEAARKLLNEYKIASGIEWQMREDQAEGEEEAVGAMSGGQALA